MTVSQEPLSLTLKISSVCRVELDSCLSYHGRPRLGLNPDSSGLECSFRIPILSFKKNKITNVWYTDMKKAVYHYIPGFTLGEREWFWRGNSHFSSNGLWLKNLKLVKFNPWHRELENQDPWCYSELGLWSSLNCGVCLSLKMAAISLSEGISAEDF